MRADSRFSKPGVRTQDRVGPVGEQAEREDLHGAATGEETQQRMLPRGV